uniref:Uncharacterized protein n=1 Tax=Meloidogyne enterolobii TaxID=390850 RepID=A0A6V7Y0P0_MELEN|nr:unnamed protein product [Meloidogyne enterolobii]
MVSASSIVRCISILLVFGFVVQCEEVGLGKHVLVNETIIELKNNTRIAENDTDLEQYRKLEGACDVTLDNEGNIILSYSKNSSTTEFGCSVDLVTKNEGQILLEFGISHSGNLSECITRDTNTAFPNNIISFSYSMNGSEFEELKNGPKTGDNSDCSNKDNCIAQRGVCRNSTAFYSVRWIPRLDPLFSTGSFTYFLQPVGDVNGIHAVASMNETFKLLIKEIELRFPVVDKRLEYICYKKVKLQKAEEWQIVDDNYIKDTNHQNFTYLFTFNIMPVKAMRQSFQDIYGNCDKHPENPGCDKDASMQKCDRIFIRFSTTTQSTKGESTTTGEETDDYYETTTRKGFTKYPKTSELGTFTIVLITIGILICITIFIGILIFFVFCVFCGKDKKKNKPNEEENSPYTPITETNKDFAIGEKGVHSKGDSKNLKGDSSTVVETQIDPTESLNNPSTVVDTQLDFDVKAGAEVPDSIMY